MLLCKYCCIIIFCSPPNRNAMLLGRLLPIQYKLKLLVFGSATKSKKLTSHHCHFLVLFEGGDGNSEFGG